MPATRAQRQRVQQRRHANLPDELIRKIIEIAGPYCVLVKGGQACSLQIPRTAGRTAKSYLAPVSNNLIRVGVGADTILARSESLADAIAAARDGDTILVDDGFYDSQRVITVPPIRLQIVGNTRGLAYGTRRTPRGEFEHSAHRESPWICGSDEPRIGGGDEEDGGVFWVEGAGAQLTLRNIAFLGVSDDWDEVEEEDEPVELGNCDCGIVATQGARVTIENCWFSNFGRMALRASSGGRIEARDTTVNRSYFGAISENCDEPEGPQSSMVLTRVDFQGANKYACMAEGGARADLQACRIRCCTHSGVIAKDAGSRIRFDASTQFVSQHRTFGQLPGRGPPWVKRASVIENGSVTFPDEIPGVGKVEGPWLGSAHRGALQGPPLGPPPRIDYQSDVEWESDDDDDDDDETRWLTIRDNGWESGHERCMNPGQEGWLPLNLASAYIGPANPESWYT